MTFLSKDIDTILALPFSGVQWDLARGLLTKKLSDAERDTAIAAIKSAASTAQKYVLDREEANIKAAFQNGTAPQTPNLSTPELQMLWGAYLATAACVPDNHLLGSPLWRQLTACDDIAHQRNRHAVAMARDQFNPGTRLKWGAPGSMFYFAPKDNSINIDLVMSLCCGFENTRSILFHEIGHSKLTVKITPAMQEVYDEMTALQKQGEEIQLNKDEYVRLMELSTKWTFMERLFDEAENSPVNRYTINLTSRITPDPEEALDRALNIVETTIAEAANQPPPKTNPEPIDKFRNLTRAIRMSLYKNNGLFPNTLVGWERIGVHPAWIEALPRQPNDPKLTSKEAFAELLRLCGGPDGLEHLQPGALDRAQGPAMLAAKTDAYADRRNAIIEDELWTRYAEPLVQPYIEQAKQQAKQRVEQAQQGQGQPQDGQGQPGQGQPGKGQPGQGQPGGSGGDPSGEAGDGKPQQGRPVNVEGAGQQPGAPVPKHPQKGKEAGAGEEGKGKSGEGKDGEDKDGKDGKGKDGEGKDESAGEGAGEGDSLESILEKMDNKASQGSEAGKGESAESSKPAEGKGKSGKGGASSKPSIPKVGDWADYERLRAANTSEINQAHHFLKAIREKQSRLTTKATEAYELLPADGNMGRFDISRHTRLMVMMERGESISEKDVHRFRVEQKTETPAKIDLVLMIDGSASMYWGEGRGAPIDAGINSGCILNEAARKLNEESARKKQGSAVNVWTVVWGNDPPLFITQPGDDGHKIGSAISGLYESQGWGTSLAPAIRHTIAEQAKRQEKPDALVGYTHMVIISDGDIGDPAESIQTIDALLKNSPTTTIDIVVISRNQQTGMAQMVEQLQAMHGEKRIKLVPCQEAAQCNPAILTLLRERMMATGRSQAIPFAERVRQLEKAHRVMRK